MIRMDVNYYEKRLSRNQQLSSAAEVCWDGRAEQYSESQNKGGYQVAEEVSQVLSAKGILDGLSVLDVGGGSGRYALPFAKKAKRVTMTDISTNMLKFAKENAEKENLHNLDYLKVDWAAADLDALGWNNKFDLVFTSMCPATRRKDGIDKMIAASKGYCHINQLIVSTDNLSEHIKDILEVEKDYDPHNDRVSVECMFNILWLQGYDPEIRYIKNSKTIEYTVEEAITHFSGRLSRTAKEKGMDINKIIRDYAINGMITVNSKSHLALITWEV